jgi:hypothetical protein
MSSLILGRRNGPYSFGASTSIKFRMSIILTDPVLAPVRVLDNASLDMLQVYTYSNVHPVSTFHSIFISHYNY